MRDKIRNKLKRSGDSPGGGWEIIYSGFVLILLCFFIMLSSFSTMEEAKIMRFVRSFISAVSILPGGVKFEPGTAVVPGSPDMVNNKSKLAQVFADLKALTDRFNLGDNISILLTQGKLVMRLSENALFDLGVATISPEAIPLLKKIGAVIEKTPYDVRIEGHTDNIPIRTAQYPSNWELSTARAVNVLRFFLQSFDIPPQRLSAVGFAQYHPIESNEDPAQRRKNRRVEIILIPDGEQKKPYEVEG